MTAPAITAPAETQRRRRGHRFYAPAAVQRRIPALYATDGQPAAEKTVHVHYFAGALDWYVVEVNPETQEAFALTVNRATGERSWGYVSLPELEAVEPRVLGAGRFAWVVERDLHWDRVPAGTV